MTLSPDLPRNGTTLTEPLPAPSRALAVEALRAEIDLGRMSGILAFGSKAERDLQLLSQGLVADLSTGESTAAADALRQIVAALRALHPGGAGPGRTPAWWDRLLPSGWRWRRGRTTPLARTLRHMQEMQAEVDGLAEALGGHERRLLHAIRAWSAIAETMQTFLQTLDAHIEAGQSELAALDGEVIPARARELEAANGDRQPRLAIALRDLRAARDGLERRVHDLRLSRQVGAQSLAALRLIQAGDEALATRLRAMLEDTLPLWDAQVAQALLLHRSETDVRAANAALADRILDDLAGDEESRSERLKAAAEIAALEGQLRAALEAAKARQGAGAEARETP